MTSPPIQRHYLRGHPIRFDGEQWCYINDDSPTVGAAERPCGHCGRARSPEGHDGCLGTVPGVVNACCGHGEDRRAYVVLASGKRLGGTEAVTWLRAHAPGVS